jgi:hypothetical protein
MSITSGDGSIYKDGYAMGQSAALKQNSMNNTIGGRGKRGRGKKRVYKGGGETVVQPVHAIYPNNGIQGLNTELTKVSAQQQSNSQFDTNVVKGGSKRRRTNRRRTNRRRTNRGSRKSRRHR